MWQKVQLLEYSACRLHQLQSNQVLSFMNSSCIQASAGTYSQAIFVNVQTWEFVIFHEKSSTEIDCSQIIQKSVVS